MGQHVFVLTRVFLRPSIHHNTPSGPAVSQVAVRSSYVGSGDDKSLLHSRRPGRPTLCPHSTEFFQGIAYGSFLGVLVCKCAWIKVVSSVIRFVGAPVLLPRDRAAFW